MKKVLCMLMCAVLLLAMPMTAFAAYEETNNNSEEYYGYGESTINKRIYSTCTVSIPEYLDCSHYENWVVEIGNANIASNEYITVSVTNLTDNNTLVLTNPNSSDVLEMRLSRQDGITVTTTDNAIAQASYQELEGAGTMQYMFSGGVITDMTNCKPGEYTGVMQYEVRINAN